MWTCPVCKRPFKRKDQQHSCTLVSAASVFEKRSPELKKLYDRIVKEVSKMGTYREETVPPASIYFKTKSTFLGLKVKKDLLEVEFFLDHLEQVQPVSKYLRTSRHRVVHCVPVDRPEDINKQLLNWIKESYHLISGG